MNQKTKKQKRMALGLILLAAFFISVVFFGAHKRWWFEDDPLQYARVLNIENPVSIFTDPERMRNFGTGNGLIPMQMLSYWFDMDFLGIDPLLAYAHSILAYMAAMALIFLVLDQVLSDRLLAGIGALTWGLLPSTLAVMQFIATRHYMEGLIWFLLVVYLVLRNSRSETAIRRHSLVLLGVLGFLAMLSKEIYAALLPTFLFLNGLGKKHQRSLALLAVGLAGMYFGYRVYIFGLEVRYPVAMPTVLEYLKFLGIIPYTFSANTFGYLFVIALAALIYLDIRKDKTNGLMRLIYFFIFLGVILLVLLPTSLPVLFTYKDPGTWYRAPFAYNTLLIFWLFYMVERVLARKQAIALAVIALAIMLPGSYKTRSYWESRMERAKAEAFFYLENPNKLMLTEEPAFWFIPGVEALYRIDSPHYIQWQFRDGDHAKAMLANWNNIWRYRDGDFVSDKELYKNLVEMNAPADN